MLMEECIFPFKWSMPCYNAHHRTGWIKLEQSRYVHLFTIINIFVSINIIDDEKYLPTKTISKSVWEDGIFGLLGPPPDDLD